MVKPVTAPPEIVAVAVAPIPPDVLLMITLGVPNMPTLTKLPVKELPEAEPSSLAALNPVFKSLLSTLNPGKLMKTASAKALCGKRHGRRMSKKRQKEERPNLGQIDKVLARLYRRKASRLKKRIEERNTNFQKKLGES
jgi:hypothetical protein